MDKEVQNKGPSVQQRVERMRMADKFLVQVIHSLMDVPQIDSSEGSIIAHLTRFKEENAGLGDDFEMGMVFGRVLHRLAGHPAPSPDTDQVVSEEAKRDLKALEFLADLDLESIDKAMSER